VTAYTHGYCHDAHRPLAAYPRLGETHSSTASTTGVERQPSVDVQFLSANRISAYTTLSADHVFDARRMRTVHALLCRSHRIRCA